MCACVWWGLWLVAGQVTLEARGGVEVLSSCELPNVGAGNRTWVPWKMDTSF